MAPGCSTGFTATTSPTSLYDTRQADDPMADPSQTPARLGTDHPDHQSGVVISSAVAPNTYLTLRITYAVKDDNAAQRTRSSATSTWEARDT